MILEHAEKILHLICFQIFGPRQLVTTSVDNSQRKMKIKSKKHTAIEVTKEEILEIVKEKLNLRVPEGADFQCIFKSMTIPSSFVAIKISFDSDEN